MSKTDYRVEIVEQKQTAEGLEVFARAWTTNVVTFVGEDGEERTIEAGTQLGFGETGTVDIERFRLVNFTEGGDVEKEVLEIIDSKKQKFGSENIVEGEVGNTTTTVYPESGTGTAPIDGLMRKNGMNATFSVARATAGSNAYNTESNAALARVFASTTTDQFERIDRSGFGFDTSAVATDTISSATLSFYINTKVSDLGDVGVCIVSFNPASESSFVASDFNTANFGTTKLASNIAVSAITTGQYTDFSLNAAGISHIDPDANTFFGVILEWDRADSFTGTWSSAARSGIDTAYHADNGSDKPKLVLEHAAGGGGGSTFVPKAIVVM